MLQEFFNQYEIIKMGRNSLIVRNRKTGRELFMHRNAFNALGNSTDIRETEVVMPNGMVQSWIEVCCWTRF